MLLLSPRGKPRRYLGGPGERELARDLLIPRLRLLDPAVLDRLDETDEVSGK